MVRRRRRYSTNLMVDGSHVHVLGDAKLTDRDIQAISEMVRHLKKTKEPKTDAPAT